MNLSGWTVENLIKEGYSIDEILNIVKNTKNRIDEEEREEALQDLRKEIAAEIVDYVEILTGDEPTKEERVELESIMIESFKKTEKQLKRFSELKVTKSDEEKIRDFVEGLKKKPSFIW